MTKRTPQILGHLTLICLNALLLAVTSTTAPTAASAAKPTVNLVSLAAGSANQYSWTVETATYPSGFSMKVGSYVSSLVISTNYTRTAAGTVRVVSGFVRVDNPGDINLQLLQVQVLVQQPAAGQAPFRSIAECKRDNQGRIMVHAQQSSSCPFAVLLPGSSTVPVAVIGQAMILDGAQLSSYPMMAVLSTSVSSNSDLDLGKCAILTDTFVSGQLYLVPDRVAAGTKMPSLGGGLAVCGTMHSLYRVSFGPYAATANCGAYKVMRTARVNPLGGDQSPVLASSLVLAQITNCASTAAAVLQAPLPSPSPMPLPSSSSSSSPSGSSSSNEPAQTVIYGPPASPSTAYIPPSPLYIALPTPAPAPVPAATPAATGSGYYYTYEYEATVPTGSHRRLQQHSSRARSSIGAASESSSTSSEDGHGTARAGRASSSSTVWPSSMPAWAREQPLKASIEKLDVQQPEASLVPVVEQSHQPGGPYLQQKEQPHQQQQVHEQAEEPSQQQLLLEQNSSGLLPAGWHMHMLQQQAAVDPSSSQHQAAIDWGQLQESLLFGYQMEPKVAASNSSDATAHTLSLQQQLGQQQGRQLQGRRAGLGVNAQPRTPQQQFDKSLWVQVLVNAHSREERWRMRRQQRQLQQAAEPGSGSTYYSATAPDPEKFSIAFDSVKVDFGVVAYSWHPKVTVSPSAVTVPLGKIAVLQYNVKVLQNELPRTTLLRGSIVLNNPLAGLLKLTEIAVEAPAAGFIAWAYTSVECPRTSSIAAPSAASATAHVVTVPARGQLVCGFTLTYPAAAPAKGKVFARAVTEAGRELISTAYSFTRPEAEPQAAKAVQLGACALFSDSFLTSADSPAVIEPTKVPASGSKAPAAASDAVAGAGGGGGVVLCNSAAFVYTATLGPYKAGQCGVFKVVNELRVRPLNGSLLSTNAATASVTVNITGCPSLVSIAAANALSAATIDRNASSYSVLSSNGAKLALPIVTLQPLELKPVTSYIWSVKNTPVTSSIKLPFRHAQRAGFIVQYKRSAAPPGVTVTGTVTVRNPNLLDTLSIAQVQVELYMPGSTGPVARAWAACPRDEVGAVVVTGQLIGVGIVACSWSIELVASGSYGDLIAAGSSAHLMAVAVTSTGREGASTATPLSHVPVNAAASPAGACAALSDGFLLVGPGGEQLLIPTGSNSSSSVRAMAAVSASDLLPGEAGGGKAADVVCDSISLSYGANYGPLTSNQCGSYKTINFAIASPTTGQGKVAAAGGGAVVDVIGCPGAAAALRITALKLQLLKATLWNVTGQASAPAGTAVQVSVGSTADVAFGLRYIATPALPVRQAVGSVSVNISGSTALSISQLLVDVTPVSVASIGQSPLITWTSNCPGAISISGVTGSLSLPADSSSIVCSFSGLIPDSLIGSAAVVARLQLVNGIEIASPATVVDLIKSPTFVVHKARCAIVADQFLSGPGLLVPSRTSRPAAAAFPTQICNSQSVSYVATLGPFTKAQCGQPLGVVNIARVNPVSISAVQLPISTATVVGVNVTGGCSSSSSTIAQP